MIRSRRQFLELFGAAGLSVGVQTPAFAQLPAMGRRITAFIAVNVIPMDSPKVLRNQTVITEGDRITTIGPMATTTIPIAAEIVDGRGKFIMPGLADMHVHLRHKTDLLLYLANGVTTVRNMSGTARHLAWRKQVADGSLPGPTIVTAGPVLLGRRSRRAEAAQVRTAADVPNIISGQKTAGYDFVSP